MQPLTSQRVAHFGETVFAVYTRLAQEHGAVNLGQGFPDFDPPELIMNAYRRAAAGYQQYAPLPGMPALTGAVARVKGSALNRTLDPVSNVQITVGATEGLFAACQALINPGDEVVLLEPFYDAYPADVHMAGGAPRYVPLLPQRDGSWQLDVNELRKAFSNRTKAVILNTPHNPTGKVFSAEELDSVITLAEEYGAVIISDEAYEHIAFTPHLSPVGRPGGWERTLSVSSIGKTFSVTGWKVGYVVGPEPLVEAVRRAHQWIPYTVATPLQVAAAAALEATQQPGDTYFTELRQTFLNKHDLLLEALTPTPFEPYQAQGGYFVLADSSALGYPDDVALCKALPERCGVGAIPPSAFYSEAHRSLAKGLVRFAFCKSDAALQEAGRRLTSLAT